MASFVLSFFPLDVLDEIWDLIESVSEGFLTYTCARYGTVSGKPSLVDRMLALHAGSRGFDSHRGTCPNDFSDPIDQDIRTQ